MRVFAILMLVVGAASLWAQEQLFLQPPDLEPGEQYRLLFVTSKFRDATSTDIEDYNDFVQQVADDSPIVGPWGLNWSVVASTETVDARTNTDTDYGDGSDGFGVPIYRLDGVRLVSDYRGLWEPVDHAVLVPGGLNLTELGTTLESNSEDSPPFDLLAFAGTTRSGYIEDSLYLGVDPNLSETVGTAAPNSPDNFGWFVHNSAGRLDKLPFYAMSEVITAVPEPTSRLSAVIAFVIAMMFRRRTIQQ